MFLTINNPNYILLLELSQMIPSVKIIGNYVKIQVWGNNYKKWYSSLYPKSLTTGYEYSFIKSSSEYPKETLIHVVTKGVNLQIAFTFQQKVCLVLNSISTENVVSLCNFLQNHT